MVLDKKLDRFVKSKKNLLKPKQSSLSSETSIASFATWRWWLPIPSTRKVFTNKIPLNIVTLLFCTDFERWFDLIATTHVRVVTWIPKKIRQGGGKIKITWTIMTVAFQNANVYILVIVERCQVVSQRRKCSIFRLEMHFRKKRFEKTILFFTVFRKK